MHRAPAHRRRSSRLLALAVTGSLALLPVGATSAAASAQPSDWWWDTYDIQALHDAGWTGSGVKIAVLDDAINPDLPVFAGADLTIADGALCADKSTAVSTETTSGAVHGTTITASLIGGGEGAGAVRGIAPDAEVTFYGLGRATDEDVCDGADPAGQLSPIGVGLKRAIDDGARIVTSSVGAPLPDGGGGDADVIAEAVAKGVIFVNGTGNPSQAGQLGEFALEGLNGIVAATAVDRQGNLQQNTDGTPYVVPQTTVVAAGVDLPTVGRTGGTWDDSVGATGSSFAAPLVAGMLALAAQKFPDATGNQLVQSLLHTTDGETHEPTRDPSDGYGYGAAWPASLLAQDPSGYPDSSPLLTDPAGMPTAEMVAAAAQDAPDDSATAAPTDPAEPSAPGGGMLPVLIIVLIVLAVVVVGAVITIVIVISRKNRTTGGGTP